MLTNHKTNRLVNILVTWIWPNHQVLYKMTNHSFICCKYQLIYICLHSILNLIRAILSPSFPFVSSKIEIDYYSSIYGWTIFSLTRDRFVDHSYMAGRMKNWLIEVIIDITSRMISHCFLVLDVLYIKYKHRPLDKSQSVLSHIATVW